MLFIKTTSISMIYGNAVCMVCKYMFYMYMEKKIFGSRCTHGSIHVPLALHRLDKLCCYKVTSVDILQLILCPEYLGYGGIPSSKSVTNS